MPDKIVLINAVKGTGEVKEGPPKFVCNFSNFHLNKILSALRQIFRVENESALFFLKKTTSLGEILRLLVFT